MSDSEPLKLFSHVAVELNALKVGYLHVFEGSPGHWAYAPGEVIHPSLRKLFQGALILNGGYDAKLGGEAVTSGLADTSGPLR